MLDAARALQLLYKVLNEIAQQWEGTPEEWAFFLSDLIGITDEEFEELDERGLIPSVNK